MGNSEKKNESRPVPVDNKTLDLVSYIRGQGFTASEISLASLVADPEITCRTRKQYQLKLQSAHGINIDYDRICELMRDDKFLRCVDMIYTVEEGHMLRAVWKNMFRRAAHPEDPHAVAAATLIFKARGLLQRKEEGQGGTDVNSYSEFIKQFRQAQRDGKGRVTVRERSVSFDASPEEALPESGPQSGTVVEGNFRSEPSRSDDQTTSEDEGQDNDPG